MHSLPHFSRQIDLSTMVAAAFLVLAVIAVIKIGKVLLLSALFGAAVGATSLAQGSVPSAAADHAGVGFVVGAATLFLIKFTKSLLTWLLITAVGVGTLLLFGFAK